VLHAELNLPVKTLRHKFNPFLPNGFGGLGEFDLEKNQTQLSLAIELSRA